MTLDFLEEIYQDAKLISELRWIAGYAQVRDEHHTKMKYTEILPELIRVCQRHAQSDETDGKEFLSCIQEIHRVSHDLILIADIIEHRLLPILTKCMQDYGTIQTENEEGDFLFQSTVSGFLTVKDLRNDIYIHSTVDPMFEAGKVAEYFFDPRKKSYSIRGCGLGYLPYQLYVITNGAASIRVFEKDARMVEYARQYGVLDWIPADCISVIVDEDPLPFLESTLEEDTGFYMLVPELSSEADDVKPILMELYVRYSTNMKFKRHQAINYWSNLRQGCKRISEFDTSRVKKDVIVVAAGPSLDDNLEFLRENVGKMTIIAVGTVFKKLLAQEILPDMVAVLDPQERTYRQIDGAEEQKVPMLLAMTAYWKFAAAYRGEKYLVPSKELEDLDNVTEKYEDVWNMGGTVTYFALEAAVRFKAERIYLVGVDLAYPGGITHATETLDRTQKSIENLIPIEGANGTTVYSDKVFISYRYDIEDVIAHTPWISYYNMSNVGAKIAGTQMFSNTVEQDAKMAEQEETEKSRTPLVSVVIPTYNRIDTLPRAIDSVLNQTYENLEVIVVDDGSTDGTEEYVRNLQDERVQYVKGDGNRGPAAARNMGARLAKGEYIAFQDSDDEWHPDKLEKQMPLLLDSAEGYNMVYCEYTRCLGQERQEIVPSRVIPLGYKRGNLFVILLLHPLVGTPTIVMEKQHFVQSGGFNEKLKTFEDYEFTLRIAQNHRIGFVEESLVKVYDSQNSVDKRFADRIRTQAYIIREMIIPLREYGFLWEKLVELQSTAERLKCHDVFLEELQKLQDLFITEQDRENAAELVKKTEQSDAKQNQFREATYGALLQTKQRLVEVYLHIYRDEAIGDVEIDQVVQQVQEIWQMAGKFFSIPPALNSACSWPYAVPETGTKEKSLSLLTDLVKAVEELERWMEQQIIECKVCGNVFFINKSHRCPFCETEAEGCGT